ncbi:MAG: hypothetical protein WKF54_13355 [Nocardioidaceae bacterium]
MLTGVIYGAIVVVWAAYLVPLALRRHDEASRSRSIARFSSAMRVLARRGATVSSAVPATARVVVTPPRGESRVIVQNPVAEHHRAPDTPRPDRATGRAAAARRRRVLSVLCGITLAVTLVAVLGLVPLWSVALPAVGVVAFLVIARRSVRQANEAFWALAAAAPEESRSVVVRRAAARVDASRETARGRNAGNDEPTVALTAVEQELSDARTAKNEHVAAVTLQTADGGSLWDPLPVTLPTYVGAPVAKRTFRTIDLNETGTWSSGHDESDTQAAPAAAAGSSALPGEGTATPTPAEDETTDEVARVVNG